MIGVVPRSHTVAAGDCCTRLAFDAGFTSYAKIYDDSANSALKAGRPNPNVLKVGDVVSIPDPEPGEHTVATDSTQRFVVRRVRALFRMVLQDEAGDALADKKYVLTIDGCEPIEGKTGSDGKVEQRIPPGARRGSLVVLLQEEDGVDGWELPLELGCLQHESATEGAKARLMNLGFDCGGESDELDDLTKDAVRGFRNRHGLGDSESLDEATRSKLRTEHEGA